VTLAIYQEVITMERKKETKGREDQDLRGNVAGLLKRMVKACEFSVFDSPIPPIALPVIPKTETADDE
jgi:hypothetical protein